MKSFEYAAPNTLKEATALLGDKWGETEILAVLQRGECGPPADKVIKSAILGSVVDHQHLGVWRPLHQ